MKITSIVVANAKAASLNVSRRVTSIPRKRNLFFTGRLLIYFSS
ncbi:MAG: hypothetical protein ABIC39_06565 [Pseudomonadota bacterium]